MLRPQSLPMLPEVSMNTTRYTDTLYQNQQFFPLMGERPQNPVGNIISGFTALQELEAFLDREPQPILLYFYNSSRPEDVRILKKIIEPLVEGTVTRVAIVDETKLPEAFCKYGHGRCRDKPFIARLFKRHVLRFLTKPITYKNVCQFITSTVQWRFKSFYTLDTAGR